MTHYKIIGTANCPYCLRAKAFLNRMEIPYSYIDITDDHEQRNKLKEAGFRTVPQIWYADGSKHIGGFDDLIMHIGGERNGET